MNADHLEQTRRELLELQEQHAELEEKIRLLQAGLRQEELEAAHADPADPTSVSVNVQGIAAGTHKT